MPGKLLVIVAGPTASGKTDLSIAIAQHFQTEIVSADSRQFYKELPIGTAQPDAGQLAKVRHHFIGEFPVGKTISAGTYADICVAKLHELFTDHQVVVLTGGSGLYIDAVLFGVDEIPDAEPEIREQLNRQFREEGIEVLQQQLNRLDPTYYSRTDIHNPRRLIRALEVCIATGKPYSGFLGRHTAPLPYPYVIVGLDWPRNVLYDRINKRVDSMIKEGLLQEAERMVHARAFNALHTVGYTELFGYMDGEYSLEEAISLIKQHSRNYAKRQMTWFRKYGEMKWFTPGRTEDVIDYLESVLKKN